MLILKSVKYLHSLKKQELKYLQKCHGVCNNIPKGNKAISKLLQFALKEYFCCLTALLNVVLFQQFFCDKSTECHFLFIKVCHCERSKRNYR